MSNPDVDMTDWAPGAYPTKPNSPSSTPGHIVNDTLEPIDILLVNWHSATDATHKPLHPRQPPAAPLYPLEEWNPSLNHPPYDLLILAPTIPTHMLLDCVFDPRHFANLDICNTQKHADTLIDAVLTLASIGILRGVHTYWRFLQDTNDAALQAQLDILSQLHTAGKITPFAPLAGFLGRWTAWDASGRNIQARPLIEKKVGAWIGGLGCGFLEGRAKEMLLTGLERPKEFLVGPRINGMSRDVKSVMEKRSSPFVHGVSEMGKAFGY